MCDWNRDLGTCPTVHHTHQLGIEYLEPPKAVPNKQREYLRDEVEGGGEERGGGELSNDGAILGTVGEFTIFDIGSCRWRWRES